jgi:hypothetical protein
MTAVRTTNRPKILTNPVHFHVVTCKKRSVSRGFQFGLEYHTQRDFHMSSRSQMLFVSQMVFGAYTLLPTAKRKTILVTSSRRPTVHNFVDQIGAATQFSGHRLCLCPQLARQRFPASFFNTAPTPVAWAGYVSGC